MGSVYKEGDPKWKRRSMGGTATMQRENREDGSWPGEVREALFASLSVVLVGGMLLKTKTACKTSEVEVLESCFGVRGSSGRLQLGVHRVQFSITREDER